MRILIISPHNDDALIGCFKVIAKGFLNPEKIYIYFDKTGFEESKEREEEAHKFAKAFNLEEVDSIFFTLKEVDTILAPSPDSTHPLHKYWAWKALDYSDKRLIYYSTDMTEWWVRPLSSFSRKVKREFLDRFFPIEADLWRCDGKYYMFEGYVEVLV